MGSGDEERGFTIVDKRGREDEPAAAGGEAAAPGPGAAGPASLTPIDFSTFVLSLATSVLYHLGLVEDPETGERSQVNMPLARQSIDTLEMIQEKTQGNLDEEEVRLLQNLLTDLRMRAVETGR